MTNKYAEGYPGARYYAVANGRRRRDAGDPTRQETVRRAICQTFTHSGSQMNQAVSWRCTAETLLWALDLAAGGLSPMVRPSTCRPNGSRRSINTVRRDDQIIDMDDVARRAEEVKPKLIIGRRLGLFAILGHQPRRETADHLRWSWMVDMRMRHPCGRH